MSKLVCNLTMEIDFEDKTVKQSEDIVKRIKSMAINIAECHNVEITKLESEFNVKV